MSRNPLGYKALLTFKQSEEIEELIDNLVRSFPLYPLVFPIKEGELGVTKGNEGVLIRALTDRFDHMLRSARSVKSNIAEGYARVGLNEYIKFLGFALASLIELLEDLFWLENNVVKNKEQISRLIKLCQGEKTMLKKQIEVLERKFITEGGYTENLAKQRREYRGF